MTIQDLWSLIDENYQAGRESIHPSELKGYRVGVDAHNLMYMCRAVVRRSLIYSRNIVAEPLEEEEIDTPWLGEMLRRTMEMMTNGITPVMVFDGPPPPEKEQTRKERSEQKQKIMNRIINELDRGTLENEEQTLHNVRKLTLQLNTLPSSSVDLAIEFFRELGIEVLVSNTDGERLCAALCIEGYVAAVLSSDGDTLAHGAPVVIRGWCPDIKVNGEVQDWSSHYRIVRLQELLQQMELCESYFIDFCILCGCDYNKRIRGVGSKRALALIKKYFTLELVTASMVDKDSSVLNYQRCRELYSRVPSSKLIDQNLSRRGNGGNGNDGTVPGEFDIQREGKVELPEPEYLNDILSSYSLGVYGVRLTDVVSRLPNPRNYLHFRRQLLTFGTSIIEVVTPKYDTMNVKLLPLCEPSVQKVDRDDKEEEKTVISC